MLVKFWFGKAVKFVFKMRQVVDLVQTSGEMWCYKG